MRFKSYKPETSAFLELVFDGKLSEAEEVLRAHPEIVSERSEHVGETPLHYLAIEGHLEGVELLLRYGADANTVEDSANSVLMHAAGHGHIDVAKLLIESGASASYARPEELETPLHSAATPSDNCEAMIALLIANGADVRAEDSLGWTPLHHEAMWGNLIAARCFLRHGADRGSEDGIGQRPVDLLRETASSELRELLTPEKP